MPPILQLEGRDMKRYLDVQILDFRLCSRDLEN